MNFLGNQKHKQNNRKDGKDLNVTEENDYVQKVYSHKNVVGKKLRIFVDCEDVTPLMLLGDADETTNVTDDSGLMREGNRRFSVASKRSTQISWQLGTKDSNRRHTPINLEGEVIPNHLETNIGDLPLEDNISELETSYLPVIVTSMAYPEDITICLEETETVFLFEMPSVTVTKGTEEGNTAEKENENYDFITVGKGRNRKIVSTEAQTNECILKTRHTLAPRMININNYAFASAWDMYDSFKPYKTTETLTRECNMSLDKSKETGRNNNTKTINEEVDFMQNVKFLDSIIVMERVLANNVYRKQQEIYKGISEVEVQSEQKNMCRLNLLWSFNSDDTQNRAVTAVCINNYNRDIIAVGYGKFRFADNKDGLVCVWSIKNPTQPERIYRFKTPVTSMAFSRGNPNFLAIGFYNGTVAIVDVTANNKKIVAQSSRKTSPSYEPIWHTLWSYGEDLHAASEHVITVGQDGRVSRFSQTKTKDFVCNPMMRITRVEENILNRNDDQHCKTNEIPILNHPPCLLFCHHPLLTDIYFIGTADGCIYKCSTNYLNQHISVIYAHDGPVYEMQFSHFCPKIFITCGADWTVKVWIEDISEPLIVLNTAMNPVESAVFCPTHSTIIAAVSGTKVFLWDLKQKIDMSALEEDLPSSLKKLTFVKFTHNGKNLIIADVNGGVHIYTLVGLPANQYHQAYLLEKSLKRALTIKPNLLMKMKKVGRLF